MSITRELIIHTRARALHEFTPEVVRLVSESAVREGLCTLFVRHTSASLLIQENADPTARADLEAWMDRHVPDGDPRFTHTDEGPDDMPSHIRAALTQTSIAIPILDARLTLGTWQGIYLWEHRRSPHQRRVVVRIAD